MEIIINGQQLDFSLENENTIGDILREIEADCAQNNATIIRICIDGTYINESDFDTALTQSVDSVNIMELETISEEGVILLLQDTSKAIESTIEQLITIPVLLQSNKDNEASAIVMQFVDQFDAIHQLMYFFSLFPNRFSSFTIGNKTVAEYLQDFTPILQEFEESLISRDTVLTGDLAEYEIVPRLQTFVDASTSLNEALC